MDIKSLAKPYEWQGATLYFMPFRTARVELVLRALNDLEPEMEWVNTKTGQRLAEEPADRAERRARVEKRGGKLPDSAEWAQERNWNMVHDIFWSCLPLVVAAEFPDFDTATSAELRALCAYWNDPGKTMLDRWEAFQAVASTGLMLALYEGMLATRDNPAPPPPELGQVEPKDPLPESGGDESAVATTSS